MEDLHPYLALLARGTWLTIQLTLAGAAWGLVVAFTCGIMRTSRHFLVRLVPTLFVELFRGTPCYVQLFWVFFVLPVVAGISIDPFPAAVFVLGSNTGSFGSEVVRSALLAVPRDQIEAATALNYTPLQRFRHVVLPQALPIMLPPGGNLFIDLLKLTPLTSLITLSELTYSALNVRQQTGNTALSLGVILIGYFLLSTIILWAVRRLEARASRGRAGVAAP
jgi:polar amino acid transport system permease protein